MELKYNKSNFNMNDFISEIGDLNEKVSGFKHQNGILHIYLSEIITPQEKVNFDNYVLNHTGEYKEYINPVSARQIRTALVLSGISISIIETALQSLPEPDKSVATIAWEYSNDFFRDNPLVNSLAPLLNLTEEDLDNLWTLARTL